MISHFFLQTIRTTAILLFLGLPLANGQYTFEVQVDSSQFRTDITEDMGRALKFNKSGDRLALFDYENSRILFYQGDSIPGNLQLLNIVGQHSLVQKNKAFDPQENNRLGGEFTGTVFKDTLWVTDYSSGEILRFDMEGNYLNTLPGRYRVLDVADSILFALDYQQIYRFDENMDSFVFVKDLPEPVRVERDDYGTNVKLGSNRLCIGDHDSLHVYNLMDHLNSDTASRLFTKVGDPIPEFEIIHDSIIWADGYNGVYRISSLDGQDIDSGNFNAYHYSFYFSDDMLFYVSAGAVKIYDRQLSEVESFYRGMFYLDLRYLGGDSANLFFYDHRDGGFSITPIDREKGIYHYDPENEIPYSGWYRGLRISENFKYLFSEWPPDSFKMYRFDTDSMTKIFFEIDSIQDFDVFGDSIYTIRGKELKIYLNDGTFQSVYTLSNLSESNLQDIDSTTDFHFAVNAGNIFIGYEGKLNVLDHAGVFEKIYDFEMRNSGRLFASEREVICSNPLISIDIGTGDTRPYMPDSAGTRGFVFENIYWYESWTNEYAYIEADLVTVNINAPLIQEKVELFQNYPNPFHATTRIAYSLKSESRIKIEVWNLQGQLVKTLVNEKKEAGFHVVEFNGDRFEPGVYFYSISARDIHQVRKMLLVK